MKELIDKIERLRAVIYPGGVYNADAWTCARDNGDIERLHALENELENARKVNARLKIDNYLKNNGYLKTTRADFVNIITGADGWTFYHNGAFCGERLHACKHTNFLTWENGSRVQLDDSSVFYKNNAGAVAILWADSVVMEYKKESNNA